MTFYPNRQVEFVDRCDPSHIVTLGTCSQCGALVRVPAQSRHDAWHEQLDHEIAEAAGTVLEPIERIGEVVGCDPSHIVTLGTCRVRTSDDFEARLIAAVKEACAKAFAAEPAFATGGFVGPQDAT